MRSSIVSLALLCILLGVAISENLQVGSSANSSLVYFENVKLAAVPLSTRTKNVFYNDDSATPKILKGISAIDLDGSKAKVTITSGGVGSSFANVRLKSERGDGLNYQVQFFA